MAASFNGTSDAYDAGNVLGTSLNQPIAVVCWVNFASLAGTQTFFDKGFNGSNTPWQLQSVAGSPATLFWGSFDGATHGITWNSTWSISAWHHVYGDYTGTAWNLYIDGILVAGPTTATGPVTGGRDLGIGFVDANGTPSQFFSGCLADAAIFNGPLNSSEITALANGSGRPRAGMSQTLLGYWAMDVGGTTQADTSGGGNNANQVTSTPGTCGTSPTFGTSVFTGSTFTQSPILQVRNSVLSY
jgi:hypothetical protein